MGIKLKKAAIKKNLFLYVAFKSGVKISKILIINKLKSEKAAKRCRITNNLINNPVKHCFTRFGQPTDDVQHLDIAQGFRNTLRA